LTESEKQLEERLIGHLETNGYERVTITNEQDLLLNFRVQVNKHNKTNLNGSDLSNKEFDRLLTKISGKSVFNSARLLREKIDIPRDNGKILYIELFNTIDWCQNIFQVTNQITVIGKRETRYDVSILINGLPLIQIELKRRGVDFKEAFHQVERYRREPYSGLFRFIQIFVISNGIDTKYFANGDTEYQFSYTFYWSDVENKRYSNLQEFAFSFLERCTISKMIARYMVLNQSEKRLMVMRPYQVYAVEQIINHAQTSNHNAYVWHTTGSGKTLTSFKASQILAKEKNIDQVIFLVDRKDLDKQTLDEFNKFDPGCVDMTNETAKLIEQIKDSSKSLIITTIQKMANAVTNPRYKVIIEKYRHQKTIFIIDECHRSQFGDMHKAIAQVYTNAQYFGFTGTPRFEVNKAQDGRATGDIFGKCLHTYLIKDAINDGNVLGFNVDYLKTIEISEKLKDYEVKAIDTDPVFLDDVRISMIARNILDIHNIKTDHRRYNALFATASIEMLVKYYDTFKALKSGLKIVAIFTYGVNEDAEAKDELSRDSLDRMIADYNRMFKTNFSINTYDAYFRDVSTRVKNNDIDILLVVNMFLTGFDAQTLNTLYVDKKLVYHNLIQAFSRTNRVEKTTKPFGNIVCYQTSKEDVDAAVRLYSRTDNTDVVLMETYNQYLDRFNRGIDLLKAFTPDVAAVQKLEDEKDKAEFVQLFRYMLKIYVQLKSFVEFNWNTSTLHMTEQEFSDFMSKYLEFSRRGNRDKVSILDDIDFALELIRTDRINVGYILELIRQIDLSDKTKQASDIKEIEEKLRNSTDEQLYLKSDLIKRFLSHVIPSMNENDDIDEKFNEMMDEERSKEITHFTDQNKIDKEAFVDVIYEYEYSGIFPDKMMHDAVVGVKFLERRQIVANAKAFINTLIERFS
jgi:type I restriction enzyme R subunit